MGVGRVTRTLGAVVTAIALFPAQAGVAQQLPSVPSVPPAPNLPPTPSLPPTPNLPPVPVEPPSTPSLPAPDVSVPEVQTPNLPATPSTPELPSTGVGTDGLPVPGSPSGQQSSPSSPAGGQASVQGQAASGGQNGLPAGGSRASVARRRARLAPPAGPGQQRLERVVRRRSACLPGLPSAQRRVVVLRSGFGPGGPQARPAVAEMLHTGVRRVAHLERQAIRALGTEGPGAACSTAPAVFAIASDGILNLLGLGDDPSKAEPGSDGSGGDAQAQVAGQSETSGVSETSDTSSSWFPVGIPEANAANLAWLTIIALLLAFAAGVGKELRSRRTLQRRAEKATGS
jgi:hypothetical protein